jgi:hypothetical protein
MNIVIYSRQLIEMNILLLLFEMKSKVFWIILSGKEIYHQTLRVVEYPPQAQSELSPNKEATGVLGIMNAIGTSNTIPESLVIAYRINSSSACIVLLIT